MLYSYINNMINSYYIQIITDYFYFALAMVTFVGVFSYILFMSGKKVTKILDTIVKGATIAGAAAALDQNARGRAKDKAKKLALKEGKNSNNSDNNQNREHW